MGRAYECSRCHHVQVVGVIDNGRSGFADPHTRCKGCWRTGTFHYALGWEREQNALIAEIMAAAFDDAGHPDASALSKKGPC